MSRVRRALSAGHWQAGQQFKINMKYEDWCKNSTAIIDEANKFNAWAEKAKRFLLMSIGPRLAKLDKTGYKGCGFHYELEQQFGRLIEGMAISWSPCANWCCKIEGDRLKAMSVEIGYRMLLSSVSKAEKSVSNYQAIFKRKTNSRRVS